MSWFKNRITIGFFLVIVIAFFLPIFSGRLPFPADTLLGIYHPWRDVVWDKKDAGIPFKNPLITDPVRQQYPYRNLAVTLLKNNKLPLWNPYSFSGTPLFANMQSGILYPLNVLFFVFSFPVAWTVLVILQPLLAGVFLYAYLRYFKLDSCAAILGALSFSFSGFFVAWLTWNTIGHVALWLPLILLAKEKLTDRFSLKWIVTLIFAESAMIFAGHPQTALYVVVFSTVYLAARIYDKSRRHKNSGRYIVQKTLLFTGTAATVIVLTSIQTIPFVQFIFQSARAVDLSNWQRPDWFLPWIHLIQLIAPDFFGNPATGNYWGIWNYGEFVSYIGIVPVMMAVFALFFRRDKKTLFFGISALVFLLLALPTPIAKIPYKIGIPFLSTLQPSRIIVLVDFSLAVMAALGLDILIKKQFELSKKVRIFLEIILATIGAVWFFVLFGTSFGVSEALYVSFAVAKRNLILPTLLTFSSILLIIFFTKIKKSKTKNSIVAVLLVISVFDLLRFGNKFTPFVKSNWIYPSTKTIEFLQNNIGNYRFMTTDRRLFPSNVATQYRLQSVDGYDPLYLQSYSDLIAAWTRGKPDITPGAFNRILTPERTDSFFPNLLGVKYILSLEDLENDTLNKVFQEGETRIYENTAVFPRAFIAPTIYVAHSKQEVFDMLFSLKDDLINTAVVTQELPVVSMPLEDTEYAMIRSYHENEVTIETQTNVNRLLVLTDMWYPSWHVFVDGNEQSIIPVDHVFRGVVVSRGKHVITFQTGFSLNL